MYYLTKVSKTFIKEKTVSSTNNIGETGCPYTEK
jgi:hypothetical protein